MLGKGLQKTLRTLATTTTTSGASIWTGLLLKRAPIVTRTLSPLEHAYLADKAFQQTLDATPFAPEFYFKKGTPAEQTWAAAQEESVPIAKQVIEPVESLPRTTEADATNDLTSLNRALERTLFLIVKDPVSKDWTLPRGAMKEDEVLHTAADRLVVETFGGQMDVWRVGQAPVGHVVSSTKDKTFFMKFHLLPGSKVAPQTIDVKEYAWVTKQEMDGLIMDKEYFMAVKDMLSDY